MVSSAFGRHTLAALRLSALPLSALLLNALVTSGAAADLSDDLHKRLEQRWYITEVIAFHDSNTATQEQMLLQDVEADIEPLEDPERATDLPSLAEPTPTLSEAQQRQALFNAENPNPAGSLDSVRQSNGSLMDPTDIALSTIGSDIGYAVIEPANNVDDVLTYNLSSYEEVLRALDRRWLNQNYLSMTVQAKRIGRRSGRTVLLHKAWLQAVPERSAPNPIAINQPAQPQKALPLRNDRRSSSRVTAASDAEPILEGELAVTVGKYLHVAADLAYYPQGKTHPEPSATFGQRFNPANTAAERDHSRFTQQGPRNGSAAQPVVELSRSRVAGGAVVRGSTTPSGDAFGRPTKDLPAGADYTATDDPFAEHNVLPPHLRLDQSRRMRSNQIHYIDHPGLGLLVKITQVPFPNLLQEQLRIAKEREQ